MDVVVVDDAAAVREGLALRLGAVPGIRVVGLAGDGLEGLALVRRLRPDVVVMDVGMPRLDGLEAARRLRRCSPRPAVVLTSIHCDAGRRADALAAGADAFVGKCEPGDGLLDAIRRVAGQGRTDG